MARARFTSKERAERRQIQRENHNRSRREQYQDPARREEILAMKRQGYQEKNNVETFDCRANLTRLGEIGKERKLLDPFKGAAAPLTFTLAELADAVGQSLQVLYRWQRKEQIPAPVMRAEVHNNSFGRDSLPSTQYVYTQPEAVAILTALGEHKMNYSQYRATHVDTKTKLFDTVQAARVKHDIQLRNLD